MVLLQEARLAAQSFLLASLMAEKRLVLQRQDITTYGEEGDFDD